MNYKIDRRILLISNGFSWLEIVGSKYISGTFKNMKEHLNEIR